MTTIGIAMTCFNRRDTTIQAMTHVFASVLPAGIRLRVYLTDAASPDGTAAAVSQIFPSVRIIPGDNTLFWNAGMRLSLEAAYRDDLDFVLWLNDDSMLVPTALADLLAASARCSEQVGKPVIVTGTTRDAITNEPTYGGVVFPIWWRRTTPSLVHHDTKDIECESLNGNIVLVPRTIFRQVGNLDPGFTHGMGDFDYGFRARAAGFGVFSAAGYHGYCSRNDDQGTYRDVSLPFRRRWSLVCGPKARPWKPWALYTRRHCGPLWFLYWAWPYFYTVTTSLSPKRKEQS
jgi:GT2 family glycosyltransferase